MLMKVKPLSANRILANHSPLNAVELAWVIVNPSNNPSSYPQISRTRHFLGPKPAHLTSIYWRDENRTVDFMTSENLLGRQSLDKELFLLVGPSTFSAAEDFCYSLQQLKRATLVGEKTRGGAHSPKGQQRLSPLFTAMIPVGENINPITRTNWEGVGVTPDVKAPAEKALLEAHLPGPSQTTGARERPRLAREPAAHYRRTLRRKIGAYGQNIQIEQCGLDILGSVD
jgi:hypothetical protein